MQQIDIQMQKEHCASSGETKVIEQKTFDKSSRIDSMEMSALVLRYDKSVQTIKIGIHAHRRGNGRLIILIAVRNQNTSLFEDSPNEFLRDVAEKTRVAPATV